MTALITTGGRAYRHAPIDRFLLDELVRRHSESDPITTLYEGEATGSDQCSREWAKSRGIAVVPVRADWRKHAPSDPRRKNPAGPIRNREMVAKALAEHEHVVGVAFPGGKGTADCVSVMRSASIPVEDLRGRRGCQRWGRHETAEWKRGAWSQTAALAIWQSHADLRDYGPAIVSAHLLPTPWPEFAVYCGRAPHGQPPNPLSNPVRYSWDRCEPGTARRVSDGAVVADAEALEHYRLHLRARFRADPAVRRALESITSTSVLICWCPETRGCHAEVVAAAAMALRAR